MNWILAMMNFIMKSKNATDDNYALGEYITDANNSIYPDNLAEAIVRENRVFAKDLKDYLEQELNK